ncbi:hypothetical protein ACIQPR_09120 [Streptomyces sp. NPDC091280]|uniref:hypothetical protein n=1 Tax=Streptomyces sp. NPDC091280 TaxID=3365984 RepID=UPI0038102EE9
MDPARLHFVHHLLEQTADLDRAAMLTSSHTITAYLYHHASGGAPPGRVCSDDRGHAYGITVELTAPVRLVTDEQAAALKTVVGELERDVQFQELERIGCGDLKTPAGPGPSLRSRAAVIARSADSGTTAFGQDPATDRPFPGVALAS